MKGFTQLSITACVMHWLKVGVPHVVVIALTSIFRSATAMTYNDCATRWHLKEAKDCYPANIEKNTRLWTASHRLTLRLITR